MGADFALGGKRGGGGEREREINRDKKRREFSDVLASRVLST